MKLHEALASGRRFRKVGTTGGYVAQATTYTAADVLADYELQPDVGIAVTRTQLMDAWNASLPAGGSVAAAGESKFFSRIAASLGL